MTSLREFLRTVKQVDSESVNAVGTLLTCSLLTHHLKLLRQIHDGHLNLVAVFDATHRPSARIAAYIHQRLGTVCVKHDLKSLIN